MSQPYKSGRQQNLNLGITSVTESTTVLQTIGKVGIGTTNAQNHSLFVVGSTNITGDVNVGGASTFVGIATFSDDVFFGDDVFISDQLFVNGIQITGGGAVIGQDLVVRNISASGLSTFVGIVTNQSTIFGTQLSVSGVSTFTGNVTLGGELRGPPEFIIDPAGIGDNTGAVRIKGDLLVDGIQTIINSATIELADFIVGIASTATTDLLADGAGIKIGPVSYTHLRSPRD